jgi:2-hydroxymuconate-semialdehyde hydrolase
MVKDSIEFNEYQVRTYTKGQGPLLLLFHGIGPGTSIPANFSSVIEKLAEHYQVIGMDLIGFGESSRKIEEPFFDFELWVKQALFISKYFSEKYHQKEIRIWGHSLGGAIALRVAADVNFISHVIASGTGGGNHRVNPALEHFWTFPKNPEKLKEAMLGSMLDPSGITEDLVAERFATLQKGNIGPYFEKMMAGNKQLLLDSAKINVEVLGKIKAKTLLIHGRDDNPCPFEDNAVYLAKQIKMCDLMILGQCGHNPARERTNETLELVFAHLKN